VDGEVDYGVWTDCEAQVMQQYRLQVRRPSGRTTLARIDPLKEIDEVEACVVARLKVPELYNAAPSWARRTIALVLPDESPYQQPAAEVTPEERLETQRRRGIARGHVGRAESTAVRYFLHPARLFESFSGSLIKARAGVFFVRKSNGKLRVITDAREGNSWMDASNHFFPLFSAETLIHVLSGLARSKSWFAVNVDLRHWFHQIPLPARLQPYFVIELNDGKRVVPRATPMGWLLAPAVGQMSTWSILLGGGNGNADWKPAPELDLDTTYLAGLVGPPAWVPLKRGGGIFVILDNVLVATPEKDVARAWAARISSQTNKYRALLKLEENERVQAVELSENNATTAETEFLGVRWRHGSRQIKVEKGERMAGLDPHGAWIGTHRDLASVLGKLTWFHRINETPMYTADMSKLRRLYSAMTPSDGRWDSRFEMHQPDWLEMLKKEWSRRDVAEFVDSVPHGGERKVAMVAVDASMAALGIVIYTERTSSTTPSSGAQEPEQYATRDWCLKHDRTQIAVAELLAIKKGCRKALALAPTTDVLVVATDSLNAKPWVERTYARTEEANTILQDLFTKVLGKTRLYLVYVPSNDNVADEPSRCKELIPRRVAKTLEYLKSAKREAIGIWSVEGGQTGGVAR
jgi:hypothetical protein